ncbi:hypothetical protein QW060_08320 [Myroides ceti]|uniref:Uncharacterized protein n=1 Tax=Paenimyroides ceti TaxID=395087 RepID=A0ABT8CVQ4_9FLAO|nr:hypothetical protein [Paenimyroides ceti]MDN3707139.1 hypothetical protein [Paenimyroides ceti]
MTAAIRTTSIKRTDKVRINVPYGSPNLSASWSASFRTPKQAVIMVASKMTKLITAVAGDILSSKNVLPKTINAITINQTTISLTTVFVVKT